MKIELGFKEIKTIPFDNGNTGLIIELERGESILTDSIDKLNDSTAKKIITLESKKKRSLSANAYLWVLLSKIAEKIGTTKELVYKEKVRDVGTFDIIQLEREKAESFINIWNSRGLGWSAEILSDNALCDVIVYYGSSVYSTKEMSLLINEVVYEAKELGIETMTLDELRKLEGYESVSS